MLSKIKQVLTNVRNEYKLLDLAYGSKAYTEINELLIEIYMLEHSLSDNQNSILLLSKAAAWEAVANALTRVDPDWTNHDGTGVECAVMAIERLGSK